MLIAHLSLTYFLLPVSRRFPSAAILPLARALGRDDQDGLGLVDEALDGVVSGFCTREHAGEEREDVGHVPVHVEVRADAARRSAAGDGARVVDEELAGAREEEH